MRSIWNLKVRFYDFDAIHEFGVDESANPDSNLLDLQKLDVGEGISKAGALEIIHIACGDDKRTAHCRGGGVDIGRGKGLEYRRYQRTKKR